MRGPPKAHLLRALPVFFTALVGCGPFGSEDVTEAGPLRLVEIGTFESPTYLTAPARDERLFVTERAGAVRIVEDGAVLEQPFLDISDRVDVDGEGGLLSMAFAPDFAESGRFYVYYTDLRGDIRIDAFERSDSRNSADLSSRTSVLRLAHNRPNHKGGQIQFGPDGKLYAGFGDGGGSADPDRAGQDLSVLAGKLIRISPLPEGAYTVPRDNPFAETRGARPEIFAYGLRNPYRFSFDDATGDLWIGDVGEDEVEEIDRLTGNGPGRAPDGGVNFGWSAFEGGRRMNSDESATDHQLPVLEELQEDGFCSLIGGYVIRDRSLGDRYGRYAYGDLCETTIWLAQTEGQALSGEDSGLAVKNLVSFGEDADSRLYVISLNGAVYRMERSGA